jgi:hypothetical protein
VEVLVVLKAITAVALVLVALAAAHLVVTLLIQAVMREPLEQQRRMVALHQTAALAALNPISKSVIGPADPGLPRVAAALVA